MLIKNINSIKVKKIILIIGLLFSIIMLDAQINLEKSFTSIGYYTTYFFTDAGIQYYGYNTSNNTMTIYNTDYSIYKTITIEPEEGYGFYNIYCVSTKLFNSDELIEFIFTTQNDTSISEHSMKLLNENNEELMDFGDASYARTITNNNITKLIIISKNTYDKDYDAIKAIVEVYSVPGGPSTNTNSIKSITQIGNAFPNPANSFINLPYKLDFGETSVMKIYNSAGYFIEEKKIDFLFDKIRLNIDNYKPGVYLYEYNGVTKRFVVK